MIAEITHGIRVAVEVHYKGLQPVNTIMHHVFAYEITIENCSDFQIQLMKRKWEIFDAGEHKREVTGDGVVGQMPVISPGHSHKYNSWCPTISAIGSMKGYYTVVRRNDNETLQIKIPEFYLIAPFILN